MNTSFFFLNAMDNSRWTCWLGPDVAAEFLCCTNQEHLTLLQYPNQRRDITHDAPEPLAKKQIAYADVAECKAVRHDF